MKMVASQAQCNSMQLWSICSIFIFITVNIQDHLCQGKPNVQDIIVLVLSVSNIIYVYSTYCVHGTYKMCYLKTNYFLGTSCRVIPTQIIGRLTGDNVPFPNGDNCTHCNDTVYFHCYSPTKLSDNQYLNITFRGWVYQWRYSPSDVPVLFVFPTNFSLNNIKLTFESGPLDDNTLLGLPMLKFYHVPNDFDIWNYSNLSQLKQLTGVVQLGERQYMLRTSYGVSQFTLSFTPDNISTKKLLMVITFIEKEFDFSISEIEFNVMSENCPPPHSNVINIGITITNVQFSRNVAVYRLI